MVAFSYRQTVYAYPHGGGSYNVSRQIWADGRISGCRGFAYRLYYDRRRINRRRTAAVTSALIAAGFNSQITHLTAALPPFLNLNVILSLVFMD